MIRSILRHLLFYDKCASCEKDLTYKDKSICGKCLRAYASTCSIKRYENIYFFWYLNEHSYNIIKSFFNRKVVIDDILSFLGDKIKFIEDCKEEFLFNLKGSKFFDEIFKDKIKNRKSDKVIIFKDYIKEIEDKDNLTFTLFLDPLIIFNNQKLTTDIHL